MKDGKHSHFCKYKLHQLLHMIACVPWHMGRLLIPQSHCAEWGRIDNSSLFGWSFLVILAMTINSNSVLLVHIASAGRYESFEHVQIFSVPSTNTFHSWLCALKTCSYLLCRTAYVLYSSHSYCIPSCSSRMLLIITHDCSWPMTSGQTANQ